MSIYSFILSLKNLLHLNYYVRDVLVTRGRIIWPKVVFVGMIKFCPNLFNGDYS